MPTSLDLAEFSSATPSLLRYFAYLSASVVFSRYAPLGANRLIRLAVERTSGRSHTKA